MHGDIIDDLGGGIKIVQNEALYKFTSDSVLLSRFARVKKGDSVADFCAGSGIVSLNLYAENLGLIKEVTFFELQESMYEMSKRTIALNGLANFRAENCRIQNIDAKYYGKFSLIVSNPPQREAGSGDASADETDRVARHEIELTLCELFAAADKCLKYGGRLALIHRADRLVDIICGMRERKIEPKRICFALGKGEAPYAVMVEGVKGGKSAVKIERSVKNY